MDTALLSLSLSLSDWLAVAAVVLPLAVKACTELAAYLDQRHNSGLARIAGMAARQAATIGRALAAVPAGSTDARAIEARLLTASVDQIMTEMGASVQATGANPEKVGMILQGELDKVLALSVPSRLPGPSLASSALLPRL